MTDKQILSDEQIEKIADKHMRFVSGRDNSCAATYQAGFNKIRSFVRDIESALAEQAAANAAEAKQGPMSLSRDEFHDKAWALYHAKTFDDTQLAKVNIHTIRAVFNAVYDALPVPINGNKYSIPADELGLAALKTSDAVNARTVDGSVDERELVRLATKHHIRFPTNKNLVAFVAALPSPMDAQPSPKELADMIPEGATILEPGTMENQPDRKVCMTVKQLRQFLENARHVSAAPTPAAQPTEQAKPVGMFYQDSAGLYHQVPKSVVQHFPNDPGRTALYAAAPKQADTQLAQFARNLASSQENLDVPIDDRWSLYAAPVPTQHPDHIADAGKMVEAAQHQEAQDETIDAALQELVDIAQENDMGYGPSDPVNYCKKDAQDERGKFEQTGKELFGQMFESMKGTFWLFWQARSISAQAVRSAALEELKNATGCERYSDQSVRIIFSSCRSASAFENAIRSLDGGKK